MGFPYYLSAQAELDSFRTRNEKFNVYKFHRFMRNHQAMLYPAFQMQQALHTKIVGESFWEKQTARREARSQGEYVSLAHFMLAVSSINRNEYLGPIAIYTLHTFVRS